MQPTDPRLTDLSNQALQATAQGRLDDAAGLWQRLLALSPEHPKALFHLGQLRLRAQDPQGSLALLERAAKAAPADPAIGLNASFAHRALGDVQGEMQALMRSLAIDPYFYPSLLSLGYWQEQNGQKKSAAVTFANALKIAPPEDRLPQNQRILFNHARDVVQENRDAFSAFVDGQLAQLYARHGQENLGRFEECKAALVGTKRIYVQEPAMLHFPRLPAIQFYDNADFPWIRQLEAATPAIRDELLAVLKSRDARDEFVPYIEFPPGAPVNQWAELNHSARWSTLFLWKNGARIEEHCRYAPRTMAALETVPLIDIPNLGPTVMFSELAPHTRIPAHTGDTNVRLVVHLPLVVPAGCGFRVGNETREWKVGEAWVFDDTIEHEAWNDSDETRVILIVDVWNPLVTPAERALVSALLDAKREYYSQP